MKKILFCLLSVLVFSISKSQTHLTAPLVRNNPADNTYSTHIDSLGFGGFMALTDTVNRNNIPIAQRKQGMVAVTNDSLLWQLQGGVSNINWVLIFSGHERDTVHVGYGLEVIWDSTGHQLLYADHADGLVSGGLVTYSGTGLIYDVTPALYVINHTFYQSPQMQVTLSASDPTFSTQYIFVVDTNNVATFVRGTPAALPLEPQIDVFSQIALTSGITILAGATTPPTMYIVNIFDEDLSAPSEYIPTTALTIAANFANTDNPYHLTKAAFISTYASNAKIIFTSSSTDSVLNGEVLSLWIYLNVPLGSNRLSFGFYNGTTASSNLLTLNSANGLNTNLTGQYQHVVIPLSTFTWSNIHFNNLKIIIAGNDLSGAGGFYLDYLQLQTGINNIPPQTDYSNKQDSNYVSNDSLFWCVKGICKYLGQVNGSGNDSAYIDATTPTDSTIRLRRQNGGLTTLTVIGGGTVLSGTGYVKMSGLTPSYVTNIPTTDGGTGLSSYTTGDLLYASATNVLSKLAIGTNGKHLEIAGGLPVWRDTTAVPVVTPAALTKTDDTNVTLTLGGTPSTALLQATSLALGWTGVLSIARGGTNNGSLSVTNGNLFYGDGTKFVSLAVGTAGQHLVGGTTPHWVDTTAAGGGGTVTTVSDLAPLFTTATRTTTPTFSLSNAAPFTFFMNNTGSSAAPTYVAGRYKDSIRRNSGTQQVEARNPDGSWTSQFIDSIGGNFNWLLAGNTGKTFPDTSQFLGTTNNTGIIFKTNNRYHALLDSIGNFKVRVPTVANADSGDITLLITTPLTPAIQFHNSVQGSSYFTNITSNVFGLGTTVGGILGQLKLGSILASNTGTSSSFNVTSGAQNFFIGGSTDVMMLLQHSGLTNIGGWGAASGSPDIQGRINGSSSISTGTQFIRYFGTTQNVMVGTSTSDITSSLFTVNPQTNATFTYKVSIPAPKITTGQRDSITTGVVAYTRAAGSGGTNGTYTNVAFTGGTGAGFHATLTVSGNVVTNEVITDAGGLYTVGDVLTQSTVPGLTGFSLTLTVLTSTVAGAQVYNTTDSTLDIYSGVGWAGFGRTKIKMQDGGTTGKVGQVALVSGTKALTINGVATSSRAFITLVSQAGTTTTTQSYEAVCTANTLTINAVTNAGSNTVNTLDTSTLNYFIVN